VEELMSWQMKFPSGLIANCSTHYRVHESRYYRVFCEKGWLHMDKAYAYKGQQLMTARAEGVQELQQQIGLAEKDQFGLEMDHFSECVIENKMPYTTGEEGLQDQIIMEAIYQSAKEGKPVKLQNPGKKMPKCTENGLLPAIKFGKTSFGCSAATGTRGRERAMWKCGARWQKGFQPEPVARKRCSSPTIRSRIKRAPASGFTMKTGLISICSRPGIAAMCLFMNALKALTIVTWLSR